MVFDEDGVIAVVFSEGGVKEHNSAIEKVGVGVLPGANIPYPLYTQCCSYVVLPFAKVAFCEFGKPQIG